MAARHGNRSNLARTAIREDRSRFATWPARGVCHLTEAQYCDRSDFEMTVILAF